MAIAASPVETRLEVQKLNELPAMSLVAEQFLEAVEDTDVEVRKLANIIERDPALTARIIGLANAAYFGLSERVTTVEEAIFKVLGINTAKSLALSIILSGPFDAGRCPGFDPGRYWANALATATLAQRLAPLVRVDPKPQPSEAYLCGLLHDLGVLVVVHLYPQTMAEAFGEETFDEDAMAHFERSRLGADHHEIGGWLARKWHLPPLAVTTIEHYADGQYRQKHWSTVRLVGYSRHWIDRLVAGDPPVVDAADPVLQALGLNPRRLASVIDELGEKFAEIEGTARMLARN